MSKPFHIDDIKEGFIQQFPTVAICYEAVPFNEGKVHAFFVTFENQSDLIKDWFKVSNYIAIYFISKIDIEFEKWNTYLFYSCQTGIPREVQYKIENDTFGSRKICVDHEVIISDIISDHILNSNLNIQTNDKIFDKKFQADPIIIGALKNKNIRRKRTDDIKIAFEEILKLLKN